MSFCDLALSSVNRRSGTWPPLFGSLCIRVGVNVEMNTIIQTCRGFFLLIASIYELTFFYNTTNPVFSDEILLFLFLLQFYSSSISQRYLIPGAYGWARMKDECILGGRFLGLFDTALISGCGRASE